jgi:1,4-alpha-glucan branching enzyme
MIKRNKVFGDKTRITFSLPRDTPPGPVSVVGDFNGWEPGLHELKRRKDGTRTVTVSLGPGEHRFRYLATDGVWLDDEQADRIGPHGSELVL